MRLKKIDMAKYLVTSSNKTISEIALALGSPHPQPFYCQIKRFVGCSPSEYRQQGNNKPN
ncbi:MAG: helix-turn-helix domain-containing protein [Butyricimonas paravirosa]